MVYFVNRTNDAIHLVAGFCGFQPKKKGTYVVDVIQDGAKFPGSPFQIQIGDSEVCSASRVKVSGAAREGTSQQWNDVKINVEDAGKTLYIFQILATTVHFCRQGCICVYVSSVYYANVAGHNAL